MVSENLMAHWRSGKLASEDVEIAPGEKPRTANTSRGAEEQVRLLSNANRAARIAAIAACIAGLSAAIAAWIAYQPIDHW